MTDKRRITTYLPPDIYEQVRRVAYEDDASIPATIERAVRLLLRERPAPPSEKS